MKRTKILSLLAIILILSTQFISCGNKEITLERLYEPDFETEHEIHKTTGRISELDGFKFDRRSTENILTFTKKRGAYTVYRFYNLETQRLILECVTGLNTQIHSAQSNVLVLCHSNPDDRKKEYVAFDFAGNELARGDSAFAKAYEIGDLVMFNNTAYSKVEGTGELVKRTDIPDYLLRSFYNYSRAYNDNYYYMLNSTSVIVCDHSFNFLYSYSAPSTANGNSYVLNDGKVLIQYSIALPEEASSYDFYTTGSQIKYDLRTVIVDPEKKKTTELKFDYIIEDLSSSYELNKTNENYSDSFENIVYVYPILDKLVDTSSASKEIFYMDNNGKLEYSLKMVEGQSASIPKRISNDRYLVDMLDGSRSIIDAEGNVINRINSAVELCGEYFVTNNAIYNLDMELIYDTRTAVDGIVADIIGTLDNAVIVSELKDDKMVYYSFVNGEKIKIHTIYGYPDSLFTFEVTNYGCIVKGSNRYTCYSVTGEELVSVNSYEKSSYSWKDTELLFFTEKQKSGHSITTYYVIYK